MQKNIYILLIFLFLFLFGYTIVFYSSFFNQPIYFKIQQKNDQIEVSKYDFCNLALNWTKKPFSTCFPPEIDFNNFIASSWNFNFTLITIAIKERLKFFPEFNYLVRYNRLSYCQKYGCRYCEVSDSLDPSRIAAWSKLKSIQFFQDYSPYLGIMDIDAIFVNFNLSFNPIIQNFTHFDGILTFDYNIQKHNLCKTQQTQKDSILDFDQLRCLKSFPIYFDNEKRDLSILNTGVMIWKTSNWTMNFIQKIYNSIPEGSIGPSHWADQLALSVKNFPLEFKEHIKVIDSVYMNTHYNNGKLSHFIWHLAGIQGGMKEETIVRLIPKMIQNNQHPLLCQTPPQI